MLACKRIIELEVSNFFVFSSRNFILFDATACIVALIAPDTISFFVFQIRKWPCGKLIRMAVIPSGEITCFAALIILSVGGRFNL